MSNASFFKGLWLAKSRQRHYMAASGLECIWEQRAPGPTARCALKWSREGVAPESPAQPPCPAGRQAPTLSVASLVQLASVERKSNTETLQNGMEGV